MPIKVYFNFSVRASKEIICFSEKIFTQLSQLGYKHTFSPGHLGGYPNIYLSKSGEKENRIVSEALSAVRKSQIIVLEVSVHSITQGYIIAKALEESKPVICLHHKGTSPAFLYELNDDLLQIIEYDAYDLVSNLKDALLVAREALTVRYNILLTPKITNYLKWLSKKSKMSRSVFIRELIQEHMANNKEYQVSETTAADRVIVI